MWHKKCPRVLYLGLCYTPWRRSRRNMRLSVFLFHATKELCWGYIQKVTGSHVLQKDLDISICVLFHNEWLRQSIALREPAWRRLWTIVTGRVLTVGLDNEQPLWKFPDGYCGLDNTVHKMILPQWRCKHVRSLKVAMQRMNHYVCADSCAVLYRMCDKICTRFCCALFCLGYTIQNTHLDVCTCIL